MDGPDQNIDNSQLDDDDDDDEPLGAFGWD